MRLISLPSAGSTNGRTRAWPTIAPICSAPWRAETAYFDAAGHGFQTPFQLWHETLPDIESWALANDFNRLGASFGASMLERAVMDGLGRCLGKPLFQMVVDIDLGIDLGAVAPELAGKAMKEFLRPNRLSVSR